MTSTHSNVKKNLFITGPSGTGKSTLIKDALLQSGLDYSGFCTLPYKIEGHETGYYIHAFSNKITPTQNNKPISVRTGPGQRIPIPQVFDQFGALYLKASLSDRSKIILMDELGILEESAPLFQAAVKTCLDSKMPVVGVLKDCKAAWLDGIKARTDTKTLLLESGGQKEVSKAIANFLFEYTVKKGEVK